ncbi:MAG: ATP-dependent zinc protease [Halioglobus sp.]|nr:ATP-dependent zinc protease [Halioglobus sp.]
MVIGLLSLLGGCVAQPQQEQKQDTRLDKVVSQLDQSLANQASAKALLQAQQQQLEEQEQNLVALSASLGKVLKAPTVQDCPKVKACPPVSEVSNKTVVGGLEKVWFPDMGLALTARVDTGVATASIDAHEIEQFERDGKPWVRFSIKSPETGESETLERRLVRTLGVQSSGGGEAIRRPVVKLAVVVGQNEQTAEFSLSSRTHTSYQLTIGRSILRDVMVVDVSKKNVAPYVIPEQTSDRSGESK